MRGELLPKEPDPDNPQAALTTLIVGDTLKASQKWEPLKLDNVHELLAKHLPALRAKHGRDVNASGAYIDLLELNLYCGPGAVEVWGRVANTSGREITKTLSVAEGYDFTVLSALEAVKRVLAAPRPGACVRCSSR